MNLTDTQAVLPLATPETEKRGGCSRAAFGSATINPETIYPCERCQKPHQLQELTPNYNLQLICENCALVSSRDARRK